MLRVDLGPLRREGSVLVEVRVPSDHGLWDDSGLEWASDVDVSLSASFAGTGEMIVRGRVTGVLDQECRRCLQPVETEIEEDVTMVFLGDAPEGEGDAEVYAFDAGGLDLDLGQAVREELILAINPYVVCDPECRGLCPMCGTNLNEGACDCSEEETDPRWEALRALKDR
jgi:uncharacterized protein